jgi:hypothetical protein
MIRHAFLILDSMNMSFKTANQRYTGKATTIEKENEFQYLLDLGGNMQFTIYLNDEGNWETNNPDIDPEIVMYAGDAVENMEGYEDVLRELDVLRN